MKGQNAHESILVVGASSHCFNKVNVRTLHIDLIHALTAGVVRVAPHDDVTDSVQDVMGLFKVPPSLFTTFVGEITLYSSLSHQKLHAWSTFLGNLQAGQNCVQIPISSLFLNFEVFKKVCNGGFVGYMILSGIKLVIFGHCLRMVSVCVNARKKAG